MKTFFNTQKGRLGMMAMVVLMLTSTSCRQGLNDPYGGVQLMGLNSDALSISTKVAGDTDAPVPVVSPNQESFTPNIPPISAND